MNITRRELTCLVDSLRDFLESFDHASECIQVPLPKPKVEIGSTESKGNLFAHYYSHIIEHRKRQIRLYFRFGNNNYCVFQSTSLNYTAINFFSQKLSTLTIAKLTTSTRTDITLRTNLKRLGAITMCSTFIPNCGYNNSTIFLIGDVYCPNTKCSGKICLHNKFFQSLGTSDYDCPQCASVCQVRNIPFEDQTKPSFLFFGQGVYIFEESPKSTQDVIGDVCFPGKCCSSREKCETLGGYVTTPRSNYGCGKCGAWLIAQKVLFMLQSTKTDKRRFFFAKKKDEIGSQFHFFVPCESTKYRKRELGVDNKVQEAIEDVHCPTCSEEKCVYSSTNETTSLYDCKKCKACCHVLNKLFKDQKPTNMLFGGDGTLCFARRTSSDYEKEKPSPFFKKCFRQSQPSTSEPEPKNLEVVLLMA